MDTAFFSHPALTPVWTILIVTTIEKWLNWPEKAHPLTLLRILAHNMASKVHPDQRRPESQQKVSGTLAIVVLSIPLLVIASALILFAEYSAFFDGLMLLIALQFQPVIKGVQRVEKALQQNKKMLARNLLSKWVLRETSQLSQLGIIKTSIETLLLRFSYQYISVLFWFLVAGGIGALTYRFFYEMSQVWNIKQKRFRHFGRPVSWLSFAMQWLPVRLNALCFLLAVNVKQGLQGLWINKKNVSSHTLLLSAKGGALDINLGGPAFYDTQKIRLPKCGGNRDPQLLDIKRTRMAINQTLLVWATFLILLSAAAYGLIGQF